MGMRAVVGALRVNLGLNSAAFRSGLGRSQTAAQKFARGAKIAFAAVAAAAAAAFASVIDTARKADEAIKTARSVGTTVEEFSALSHAAEMSGSSAESLAKAMKKASQTVIAGAEGMQNEGVKALDRLGIATQNSDGSFRDINDIIDDVADAFSDMPDGVEKTSDAMAIFGRSGTDLISMLNQGSDGIAAMKQEARDLGIVFDTRAAVAAENFNDNLTRLSGVAEGFRVSLFNAVIPVLSDLSDRMVEIATNGPDFDGLFNAIAKTMQLLGRAVVFVFEHLGDLYDLFKVFVAAKIALFLSSLVTGFVHLAKSVRTAGLAMALMTKITRAKILAIMLLAAVIAKLTGTYDDMVGWLKEVGDAMMNALPPELQEKVEDLTGAFGDLKDEITGVDAGAAEGITLMNTAADTAAGSFQDVATGAHAAGDAIDEANEQTQEFNSMVGSAFQTIGSDIAGIIDGTKTWNDLLGDVIKSFAKIAFQMVLNSFGGFDNSFWGTALSGFTSGIMNFASGGSFQVGGTGLTDSQLVAFNASPDEVVSVTTPQQRRDAEKQTARVGDFHQTNNITIAAQDVNSFRASEGQVAARIARLTQRGARNL